MVDRNSPSGNSCSSGIEPSIAGVLCYLCFPITSLIFLLIEKEDKEIRFHAWQGVSLGVCFYVALLTLQIFETIMGAIASVLGVIIGFFLPILWLATIAVWIMCLIKAYQGERWKIPILGDFAAKQAGL